MSLLYSEMNKAFTPSKSIDSRIAEDPSSLVSSGVQWDRTKLIILLQVYARYKTGFFSPNIHEQDVWEKVVSEVQKECLEDYSESQCRDKVNQLKSLYNSLNKNEGTWKKLYKVMKKGFGAAKNFVDSEIISIPASSSLKWNTEKVLLLLKAYSNHKTELNSPNVDKKAVWKKIAFEIQSDDAEDCYIRVL